jgi:hypothetical protein
MMWEDMLLDRDVSDVALAQGVAGVFAIPIDAVAVVGDIEDTLKTTLTNIQILVVRAPAEGEFPLQVSFYLRNDELERRVEPWSASFALVKQFTRLIGCSALVGDETPDVLSWLLVRPTGEVEAIMLDYDRLDRDEYVVASARPLERSETPVP